MVRGGDPGLEGEETTQAGFLDGRASDALERKGSQTAEPSMPAVQLGQESSLSGTPAPSVGNLPLTASGAARAARSSEAAAPER